MSELTLKIEDKQISFIRLILRSNDTGQGWRAVSNTLRKFTEGVISEQPELYETKQVDGLLMVRLSERGAILGDYA